MAFLGIGTYKCEACMHFDTDGIDGNHPSCMKQPYSMHSIAIRLDEECPFGYEFGVPAGYPVSIERNEERAYEVKAMMGRHEGGGRMNGFNDKKLQEIWDMLDLPPDIDKQVLFEREIYRWAESLNSLEDVLRRYMSSFDCESMKGFDCTGIDCIKCPFNSGNAERFAIAWTREINEGGH